MAYQQASLSGGFNRGISHSDSGSDISAYVTSHVQYTTYKIIACIERVTVLRANITHVTRVSIIKQVKECLAIHD